MFLTAIIQVKREVTAENITTNTGSTEIRSGEAQVVHEPVIFPNALASIFPAGTVRCTTLDGNAQEMQP